MSLALHRDQRLQLEAQRLGVLGQRVGSLGVHLYRARAVGVAQRGVALAVRALGRLAADLDGSKDRIVALRVTADREDVAAPGCPLR